VLPSSGRITVAASTGTADSTGSSTWSTVTRPGRRFRWISVAAGLMLVLCE
jgi:hypothetical protein